MRNSAITVWIPGLLVVLSPVVAPGDSLTNWTGEGLLCASGNAYWSNGNNWFGGTAPTSSAVHLGASAYCGDGCDFCACFAGQCFGGDEGSCTTRDDCDCCDAGSLVAQYTYTEGANPDHTFSSIEVEANSSFDMTLQKTGDNPLYATTELSLVGHTTHKAILDVDHSGLRPTDLKACKTTEIDVLTGTTMYALDELIAGCSTADTTLTLKGGSSSVIDVGNYTRVNAFGTTRSSTLKLDGNVTLQPDNLEIFGGSSGSYLATFHHYGTSASIGTNTLSTLRMRAYSKLDVDRDVNYTVSTNIDVDTNGVTTDAHIYMYSVGQDIAVIGAGNLTITAGASHAATLTMETGILDVSPGTVYIGADGASQAAKLKIASGAADPALDDVVIKERGVLDLRDSLTVVGILTVGEGADNADVVTQTNDALLADVIVFKKTTTFTPTLLASGSVIATN